MMDLTFYEYIAAVWNRQGLGVSVPYVGVWSGTSMYTCVPNHVWVLADVFEIARGSGSCIDDEE